jgi:quaternary ammonium compound-resistance protein SugE
MAWFILIIAGVFETVWAVSMKLSDGFTKPVPSVITVLAMGISVFLLSWSMKSLPVGVAYCVWTGIGAVGAAIVGMMYLGESKEIIKIICIFFIIAGITGLKIFSK